MPIFEEVRLEFKGEEYSIPPDGRMQAIAIAEDIITLGEIAQFQERRTLPLSKLSQVFGALLRYAGAKVENDEVYAEMFEGGDGEKLYIAAMGSVVLLQKLMIPPKHLQAKPGKPDDAQRRAARSRRSTSSSSVKGG